MWRKVTAGVLLLAGAGGALTGCGGSRSASGPTTTTSTTAPAGSADLPAVAIGTSVTTTGPLPTTATGGQDLPTGAATSLVFGSTMVGSETAANEPPSTAGVDQARVDATPTLPAINFSTTDLARWPAACSLTDLAQLKAIDPAVTGLAAPPAPQFFGAPNNEKTRPNACDYQLTTTFDPTPSAKNPTDVEVEILAVQSNEAAVYQSATPPTGSGSPAVNNPSTYVNYGNLGNGLSCNDTNDAIICDKGFINFAVQGDKITGGTYGPVDNCVWADQMLLPVAEVLGRELTGT